MADDRNQLGTEMLDKVTNEFLGAVANKTITTETINENFLRKGVNVNAQDRYGNTALFYAVRDNRLDLVILLFRNGANPNIKNISGQSPNDQIRKLSDESDNVVENKMFALFALYAYMQELQEKVDKHQTKTTGSKILDKLVKNFFNTEVGYDVPGTLNMTKDLWAVIIDRKPSSEATQHQAKINPFRSPLVASLYESFKDVIEHKQKKEKRGGGIFTQAQMKDAGIESTPDQTKGTGVQSDQSTQGPPKPGGKNT